MYHRDKPLAVGSTWLDFYGVKAPANNLTRITVQGSTDVNEWLKVTVDRHEPALLTIQRVPFS